MVWKTALSSLRMGVDGVAFGRFSHQILFFLRARCRGGKGLELISESVRGCNLLDCPATRGPGVVVGGAISSIHRYRCQAGGQIAADSPSSLKVRHFALPPDFKNSPSSVA